MPGLPSLHHEGRFGVARPHREGRRDLIPDEPSPTAGPDFEPTSEGEAAWLFTRLREEADEETAEWDALGDATYLDRVESDDVGETDLDPADA